MSNYRYFLANCVLPITSILNIVSSKKDDRRLENRINQIKPNSLNWTQKLDFYLRLVKRSEMFFMRSAFGKCLYFKSQTTTHPKSIINIIFFVQTPHLTWWCNTLTLPYLKKGFLNHLWYILTLTHVCFWYRWLSGSQG